MLLQFYAIPRVAKEDILSRIPELEVPAGMLFCDRVKCASLHVKVMSLVKNAEVTVKSCVRFVLLKLSALGVAVKAASWAMV